METMALYQDYYNEHAAQARNHEEQRERITGLLLSIAGLLIGLITFAKLDIWALAASLPIILLGGYGYLFAGKHYERFKFHTKVMRGLRHEIDELSANSAYVGKSLKTIRAEAELSHYQKFEWPRLTGGRSPAQNTAKSWIARQRLHVFWEAIHLMIVLMGIGLTISILVKKFIGSEPEITKVQVVTPITYIPARIPTTGATTPSNQN